MPHLQMWCGQPMQVPLVCASSVQAKHTSMHTSMHAGYAASCQSHATAHTCIHMYPSCATVNMMSSCEGVWSFMHITGLTNCTV